MIQLTHPINESDLIKKSRSKTHFHVRYRIEIILKAHQGIPRKVIQQHLNVSSTIVTKWIKRYNAAGFEGLLDRKRTTFMPSKVTPAARSLIADMALKGPSPHSILSRYRAKDFCSALKKKLNISVSTSTLRKYLKKMVFVISNQDLSIKKIVWLP